jgi:5S rRNA maturation endonuclease (ribonuclease M5)
MDYKKSLDDLEKLLIELREVNKKIPILVEGDKDIEALHRLEIYGKIISVNVGMSLIDFCDWIANKYDNVIILTDWDRRGGQICHTLIKNLKGRVNCDTNYRKIIAKNTMIRTVEGLPSWIEKLKEKI